MYRFYGAAAFTRVVTPNEAAYAICRAKRGAHLMRAANARLYASAPRRRATRSAVDARMREPLKRSRYAPTAPAMMRAPRADMRARRDADAAIAPPCRAIPPATICSMLAQAMMRFVARREAAAFDSADSCHARRTPAHYSPRVDAINTMMSVPQRRHFQPSFTVRCASRPRR